MFFISRGTVRVFVVSEPTDGETEENYVISLGAGSFFGEVALLDDVSICVQQTTATRARTVEVPRSTIRVVPRQKNKIIKLPANIFSRTIEEPQPTVCST